MRGARFERLASISAFRNLAGPLGLHQIRGTTEGVPLVKIKGAGSILEIDNSKLNYVAECCETV